MYENIEADRPNFCVGPQAGTYCTVDNEANPVVMHVKNDSGVIIRTYTFYPQDILDVGTSTLGDYSVLPDPTSYSHHDFVTIQYVGPYDQASYFDGAIFYTLERRAKGKRNYYSYDNVDPEYTKQRIEYDSNIIRKWVLDNANFRLALAQTFYYDSDVFNWFGGKAFAIDHVLTTFDWHTAAGTGEIEITTTSGLKKYDTLFLGPSTDTSNPGEVEEVYVHSVNGTTVEIRTYGGEDPPRWEYMEGDPITIYKDAFLFSDARPFINEQFIADGFVTQSGSLHRSDLTDYGNITESSYSGLYHNVPCATWNNYYNMLSFARGNNLLHLNTTDYEVSRSQDLHLENPDSQTPIPIYDIDIKEASIYKLQLSILQHDDNGVYGEEGWSTYNYHADTFLPYSNSVTLYVNNRILMKQGQSIVTAIVRDQFGVGLLAKNVWFTQSGDNSGELTPSDGYLTTDADGKATIQYDASSIYTGHHDITVKVDGGNNAHGSTFVVASTQLQQHHEFTAPCYLRATTINSFTTSIMADSTESANVFLQGKVAYVFPGNRLLNNDESSWWNVSDDTKIIMAVKYPTFKDVDVSGDKVMTRISASHLVLKEPAGNQDYSWHEVDITSESLVETSRKISANFISRHLDYGHIDNVTLDQFVFVQDARPAMWSEKNNVDTDYWIRLRPFAASLNPARLKIRWREESYLGDHGWEEITDLGTITMFDAGGGILGIDFYYNPGDIFHHNSIVYVDIEVYDTAGIPNIITLDYWFRIIQDYKAPYIDNQSPAVEAYNVPINASISFDLIDEGEGVDISTLEVFVNQRQATFTYDEYEPGNYHIYLDTLANFHYGETVSINVKVFDRSDNSNRMLAGWKFYCAESDGPWFDMDNTKPDLCLEGRDRKQPVAVQVYGINDTGVKYDSIKMEVGGKYRNLKITPIVYRLN